jgi:hypothetical protein
MGDRPGHGQEALAREVTPLRQVECAGDSAHGRGRSGWKSLGRFGGEGGRGSGTHGDPDAPIILGPARNVPPIVANHTSRAGRIGGPDPTRGAGPTASIHRSGHVVDASGHRSSGPGARSRPFQTGRWHLDSRPGHRTPQAGPSLGVDGYLGEQNFRVDSRQAGGAVEAIGDAAPAGEPVVKLLGQPGPQERDRRPGRADLIGEDTGTPRSAATREGSTPRAGRRGQRASGSAPGGRRRTRARRPR